MSTQDFEERALQIIQSSIYVFYLLSSHTPFPLPTLSSSNPSFTQSPPTLPPTTPTMPTRPLQRTTAMNQTIPSVVSRTVHAALCVVLYAIVHTRIGGAQPWWYCMGIGTVYYILYRYRYSILLYIV